MLITPIKIKRADPRHSILASRLAGQGVIRTLLTDAVSNEGYFSVFGAMDHSEKILNALINDYPLPEEMTSESRAVIEDWLSFLVDRQRRALLLEVVDPTLRKPKAVEQLGLDVFSVTPRIGESTETRMVMFCSSNGVRNWLYDTCTQFYGLSSGCVCIGRRNSMDALRDSFSRENLDAIVASSEALAIQAFDYSSFALWVRERRGYSTDLLDYFEKQKRSLTSGDR